jgi:hypothetical protein
MEMSGTVVFFDYRLSSFAVDVTFVALVAWKSLSCLDPLVAAYKLDTSQLGFRNSASWVVIVRKCGWLTGSIYVAFDRFFFFFLVWLTQWYSSA